MPLTQVSARFFLELALGLFLSIAVTHRQAIGAGFTRLMAGFTLAALLPAWLLARAGGQELPSVAGWLAGAFLLATILLLIAAGRVGRVLEWGLVAGGVLAGTSCMLLLVQRGLALGGTGAGGGSAGVGGVAGVDGISGVAGAGGLVLQLASSTGSMAVLGLVTGAMILGHWYLVTPDLPVAHLGAMTRLAVIATYVKLSLLAATIVVFPAHFGEAGRALNAVLGIGDGAGSVGSAGGASFLSQLDFIWLVARVALGLIGTVVLGHMTLATLKLKATQPATGILYAATVFVLMGELFAFLGERSFAVVL